LCSLRIAYSLSALCYIINPFLVTLQPPIHLYYESFLPVHTKFGPVWTKYYRCIGRWDLDMSPYDFLFLMYYWAGCFDDKNDDSFCNKIWTCFELNIIRGGGGYMRGIDLCIYHFVACWIFFLWYDEKQMLVIVAHFFRLQYL